jgi:hypothetical protein
MNKHLNAHLDQSVHFNIYRTSNESFGNFEKEGFSIPMESRNVPLHDIGIFYNFISRYEVDVLFLV